MMTNSAKVKIGCVHRIRHFPYWASLAQGISDRVAELAVELCLPTQDADDAWEEPVDEVIRRQPDVVILPHSVVHVFPGIVEPFRSAKIPIVGVEVEPGEQYAAVVRSDEAQGAATVVSYLFDRLGGQGKVANIFGSSQTRRQETFHTLLSRYPGIKLAYENLGDWTRESGVRVMRAALDAHPDLRGVFAHNDYMAIGATQVIAERGLREQIVVVGFDADPPGLLAIRDGELSATVYRGLYGVGRSAVDIALDVARGKKLPSEVCVPTKLITLENLVDATLDTTSMLPGLLRDLIESNREQRRLQQETITTQRNLIQELSTPIIPISTSILIMPLIGAIDSARAQQIMEVMLEAIGRHGAQYLIIDITGIAVVDTAVAHHLMQASQAVQLLGAQVILVGISPEIAQTLVGLGVNFRAVLTRSTLQAGFEYAQKMLMSVR
jgi:ribose transport system substrate-binding protein